MAGAKRPNGEAIAAFLASMIGLLVMGLVHIGTVASAEFQTFVFNFGKAWIPGAQGIGPYSGKETFLLIGWFGSWVLLHYALRKRKMKLAPVVLIFLVGMGLATLFVYTPFIDFILGK